MIRKALISYVLLNSALLWSQTPASGQGTKSVASARPRKQIATKNTLRKSTPPVVSQIEKLRAQFELENATLLKKVQDMELKLEASQLEIAKVQHSVAERVEPNNQHQAVASVQVTPQAPPANDLAVASLQSAVASLKGDTLSLAATVEQNKKAIDTAANNPGAIHYKGVKFTPGGFITLDTVWRQHEVQADIATPFNSIPFDGSAPASLSEFRLSARQSRMNLLAEAKIGKSEVTNFLEFDLLGAGLTSNSMESNSYIPRLRHAWLQAAWPTGWNVAVGQMWTLATSNRKGINALAGNAYLPDMIEAQYVVGLDWLRQPSVRVVRKIDGHYWLAASAEGAQTSFSARNAPANFLYCAPGTANLTSTVNYSFDAAPDILVKIAAEPGFGHYELKGLARFFRDRVYPEAPASAASAYNDLELGGGIGAAASWTIKKKVDLSLNVLGGNGVGRYGTSQLPDVTVRPDGTLAPIHGGHGLGTLEYNPTPRLKLYAYSGTEYAGRRALVNAEGLGVGYGSPLNANSGCTAEAVPTSSSTPTAGKCNADTRSIYQSVVGFWYRPYVGPMGRVQYGAQYSYTERNAWSGVGGAPRAEENMVYTSMRYYLP